MTFTTRPVMNTTCCFDSRLFSAALMKRRGCPINVSGRQEYTLGCHKEFKKIVYKPKRLRQKFESSVQCRSLISSSSTSPRPVLLYYTDVSHLISHSTSTFNIHPQPHRQDEVFSHRLSHLLFFGYRCPSSPRQQSRSRRSLPTRRSRMHPSPG
jgi:hypothetical protein